MSNRLGFKISQDDTRYNDAYVTWLAHFDTVAGTLPAATYIVDHSAKQNGRIALSDNCQFGASTGIGGAGTSIYFPNNALAYSPVNIDNSFNLSDNDFTIDWWEYAVGDTGVYHPSFVWDTLGNIYSPMLVGWGDNTALYFYASNDAATWNLAAAVPMGTRQMNTWAHRALVRKSGYFYTFENGVLKAQAAVGGSGVFNIATYGPCLGCWPRSDGYYYFWGYIDEFRVSNGIARWTANFSLPAAASPSVLYKPDPDLATVLLMHFDSSWADASQYKRGAASTFAGLTFSIAQSKFGRISARFDGLDDYMSFPDNVHWTIGDDYTIDLWLRPEAIPAAGQAGCILSHLAGNSGWIFMLLSDGSVTFLQRNTGGDYSVYGSTLLVINNWYHIAFVRAAQVSKVYINGVGGTPLTTPVFSAPNASALFAGMWGAGTSYPFKGFMDELRITYGKALWTADFTPPTDVHGATGEKTVLLLHFNGDVKDSSPKRQVVQKATALLSTAQSKFGGSSAIFSGGQLCYVPTAPADLNFGYEDFTIDFWFYSTGAAGTNRALFGRCNPSLGELAIGCYIGTANRLVCSFGKTGDTTGTEWLAQMTYGKVDVTQNTWHHYAVMRRNNVFSQYLDGVIDSDLQDYGAWPIFVSTWSFVIGALGNNNNYWTGYIDEFRVTKGKALWTANFTPPTQPGS
jgi:hypothetical protein